MQRKVFVSFDYENDRHYKYMLEAWNSNPEFQFTFQDISPDEINSYNIGRVKAALTVKINTASHTTLTLKRQARPYRLCQLVSAVAGVAEMVVAARSGVGAIDVTGAATGP